MAIVLFTDKKNCCGCSACMNICPKNAITMEPDKSGFCYPVIDREHCVGCGVCKKVCAYQNSNELNTPKKVYVAVNKNMKQLMASASGGVFAALATQILNEGGVVFGATLSFEGSIADPHHMAIEFIEDLPKLQGSKYVQSRIGDTYKQAKGFLIENRKVLFSGTPCQIAGLYGYLEKNYENLITMDVICHGVPNAEFFNGYLQQEKEKHNANSVIGYSFRDKIKGWGMNGRIAFQMDNNRCKSIYIPARLTSYSTLFLDGEIYRENCYSCKYAAKDRPSDLTVGDYWGIGVEHPELLKKSIYDETKGISCILANTEKGVAICQDALRLMKLEDSSFEKVSRRNGQLKNPMRRGKKREEILQIYEAGGYPAVEVWFKRKYMKQIVVHTIYNAIPRRLRIQLKKIMKG